VPLLDVNDLAAASGYTTATVRSRLATEGIKPAKVEGLRHLFEARVALPALMRNEETDGLSLTQERAALARAQTELTELRVARERGELLDRSAVVGAWQSAISAARGRLLSIPTKVAGRVLAARTLAEAEAILQEQIHDTLTELSGFNGVPASRNDVGLETSPEIDCEPVGGPAPKAKPRSIRRARTVADKPRRVPARNP
jgi:hypothetical protein